MYRITISFPSPLPPTQGVPEFVSATDCQYTFRWESASACPTDLPSSDSSTTSCSIVDPYASDLVLDFKLFISHVDLTTSDRAGGNYTILLCGAASPTDGLPAGCDPKDTGVCHTHANGHSETIVHANHTFSLVSHSPRVVDVIFHSGVQCSMDGSRKLTAIVQMVCSNQSENAVPALVSNEDCELRFVWRNQSFCAGESAAGGCSASDATTGYVYSLDGLLAQNWTVSGVWCLGLLVDSLSPHLSFFSFTLTPSSLANSLLRFLLLSSLISLLPSLPPSLTSLPPSLPPSLPHLSLPQLPPSLTGSGVPYLLSLCHFRGRNLFLQHLPQS